MNVANMELCKSLYELSGWDGTFQFWSKGVNGYLPYMVVEREPIWKDDYYPAYDLGYLLRKLPHHKDGFYYFRPHLEQERDKKWGAYLECDTTYEGQELLASGVDDTPEDATCKLAIELFKQGVLVKEES